MSRYFHKQTYIFKICFYFKLRLHISNGIHRIQHFENKTLFMCEQKAQTYKNMSVYKNIWSHFYISKHIFAINLMLIGMLIEHWPFVFLSLLITYLHFDSHAVFGSFLRVPAIQILVDSKLCYVIVMDTYYGSFEK